MSLPWLDSGLVASRTSGSFLRAAIVSSIGCLNLESVSLAPVGASSTTGFVPLACEGKRSDSRSVAFWLSLPGSLRLSLTSGPTVRAAIAKPAKTTNQTPRTAQRRRTQSPPRP